MIILAMLFGATVGVLGMGLFNLRSFDKGYKDGEKYGYRTGVAIGYFKGQESVENKKEDSK